MNEPRNEATARDIYRQHLPSQDGLSAEDGVRQVMERARAQLAVRDVLGFAFSGMVRLVLSLVVVVSRHAQRRRSQPTRRAQSPHIETGGNND